MRSGFSSRGPAPSTASPAFVGRRLRSDRTRYDNMKRRADERFRHDRGSMRSAGLLLYRCGEEGYEVFLVHPGGPYWAKRDSGAWSIPKGVLEPGEEPLDAARREFVEETGFTPPSGPFDPLGSIAQPSGKIVEVWSAPGDCDPGALRSQSITLEWPPRSGRRRSFPEVDRAAWFGFQEAHRRILPGQQGFLTELKRRLQAT